MDSLAEAVRKSRKKFSVQLGRNLVDKQRITDVKRLFTHQVKSRYPGLAVLWLKKHDNLAKILLKNYPDQIHEIIERYVNTAEYHSQFGLSFGGLYLYTPRITSDIAKERQRADIIAKREAEQAEYLAQQKVDLLTDIASDAEARPSPQSAAVKRFKQSAFFQKLPKIFQEKM